MSEITKSSSPFTAFTEEGFEMRILIENLDKAFQAQKNTTKIIQDCDKRFIVCVEVSQGPTGEAFAQPEWKRKLIEKLSKNRLPEGSNHTASD